MTPLMYIALPKIVLNAHAHLSSRLCVSRNCEGMESREKKMSEPNDDDDDERDEDPKPDEVDDAEPSLDSLGRPVSGSRRTHGANIGLMIQNIFSIYKASSTV